MSRHFNMMPAILAIIGGTLSKCNMSSISVKLKMILFYIIINFFPRLLLRDYLYPLIRCINRFQSIWLSNVSIKVVDLAHLGSFDFVSRRVCQLFDRSMEARVSCQRIILEKIKFN